MFVVEEESGTVARTRHPHNGYYAGDFSRAPMRSPAELAALAQMSYPTFPVTRHQNNRSRRPIGVTRGCPGSG